MSSSPLRSLDPRPAPESTDARSALAPLQDALREAGQDARADHFAAGDHPRGCWLLDQILGRS